MPGSLISSLSQPSSSRHSMLPTPLQKVKGDTWYSKVPVGHNTLSQTVGRLCKQAGISGYKTNHSLRVTSATRLFQSGIDEQLIMSHTGHRSVDGVRSYKRISEEQKKTISSVLNLAYHDDDKPGEPESTKKRKLDIGEDTNELAMSLTQSQTNMTLNACNIGSSSSSCTPAFTFTDCSSITINYHTH